MATGHAHEAIVGEARDTLRQQLAVIEKLVQGAEENLAELQEKRDALREGIERISELY